MAVPTLLTDGRHTLRMMRQLSVLYLANKNAPLDFMLLGDFSDAESAETPQDEDIITAMRMGVSALNDAYGPRFFAMRCDVFSPSNMRHSVRMDPRLRSLAI